MEPARAVTGIVQILTNRFDMAQIKDAALAHELKRWMRPDAHRFVRPDWRRFVRPGFEKDHPFEIYERKGRLDQLRDELGRWADEGGRRKPLPNAPKKPEITELSAASRKGRGHHYVATAEVNNRKISDEAKKVFFENSTGPLLEVRSNKWGELHKTYNKAVGEALDDYLKSTGTSPDKMTADQAREFVTRIKTSTDPRIKDYNLGIHMREIMQRLFRRGGRE